MGDSARIGGVQFRLELRWFCLIAGVTMTSAGTAAPLPGDHVAAVTWQTTSGTAYNWSPGRATLITFCAFWCDTWKIQLKRVEEARRETTGLPEDFLAVSVDGRWTELANGRVELNLLKDVGGAWSQQVGINTVPFTMAVDAEGVVRWTRTGICRTEDMVREMRTSLSPASAGGKVYLTFDDFPKPDSGELLDVLAREGAQATFFCIGSRVAANRALLKRALREGHSLQIHSWDHDRLNPRLSDCVSALKAIGANPTLYRPPGSERVLNLDGTVLSLPTIDPYDFQRPGATEIERRVVQALRPNAVIQLHAGVTQTLESLKSLIGHIPMLHFRLATLG